MRVKRISQPESALNPTSQVGRLRIALRCTSTSLIVTCAHEPLNHLNKSQHRYDGMRALTPRNRVSSPQKMERSSPSLEERSTESIQLSQDSFADKVVPSMHFECRLRGSPPLQMYLWADQPRRCCRVYRGVEAGVKGMGPFSDKGAQTLLCFERGWLGVD